MNIRTKLTMLFWVIFLIPSAFVSWKISSYLTKQELPHGLIFKLGSNASEDYAAGMKTGLETCGRFESVKAMKNQDGSVTFKATFKKGGDR